VCPEAGLQVNICIVPELSHGLTAQARATIAARGLINGHLIRPFDPSFETAEDVLDGLLADGTTRKDVWRRR
jgi:hypothetical protein